MVYIPGMDNKTLIEKACKAVGGQTAMAHLLDISEQAISKWKKNGIPAERVLAIEEVTKKSVTRHQMRPDIYPPNQ